mmetsp:Transcript_33477/g.55133  ORF Transcript_33477/g.55133 Transcript_33477/m.55133 type:complete len:104 (-) Transcript_33477:15-326(-)
MLGDDLKGQIGFARYCLYNSQYMSNPGSDPMDLYTTSVVCSIQLGKLPETRLRHLHQIFWGAELCDAPALHDTDAVALHDGGDAVRDAEDSVRRKLFVDCLLD